MHSGDFFRQISEKNIFFCSFFSTQTLGERFHQMLRDQLDHLKKVGYIVMQ